MENIPNRNRRDGGRCESQENSISSILLKGLILMNRLIDLLVAGLEKVMFSFIDWVDKER